MQAHRPGSQRGFLLIVIVGLLAILLVMVVGFLSYTRGETNAVSTVRDRVDGVNMFHSVLDYTIGNIAADLCSGADLKAGLGDDPKGIVSSATSTADACYKWWYRPYEPNMNAWYGVPASHTTTWVNFPDNYFNSPSIRGRYYIQVFDANALLHINDGLEDANPTQAQMAHMLMESTGDQYLEYYRRWRDTKQYTGAMAYATPLRYLHAWRMATHTVRGNNTANNTGYAEYDTITPSWVTRNSTWLSLHDVDMYAFRYAWLCDGIPPWMHLAAGNVGTTSWYFPPTRREGYKPGNAQWDAWGHGQIAAYWQQIPSYFGGGGLGWPSNNHFVCMLPSTISYALWAYTDPDTGRSPVNVNTVLRSNERVMNDTQFSTKAAPNCTMEAVFNVESLRRIIKVGKFYLSDGVTAVDLKNNPAAFAGLSDVDKRKLERLRMKLAYQYQETLCRYFTGTYNHPALWFDWSWWAASPAPLTRRYPPLENTAYRDYVTTFTKWTAKAADVKWHCKTTDLSQTRFPCGVDTFRARVKEDLRTMAADNNTAALAAPVYDAAEPKDGEAFVNFDKSDVPEIVPGKLDKRTASAVFDNIVPGKAYLFTAAEAPDTRVRDPLTELHALQLGRDETQDDFYNTALDIAASPLAQTSPHLNVSGMHTDSGTMKDSGVSAVTGMPSESAWNVTASTLRSKGRDIALTSPGDMEVKTYSSVPWRQRCFGPDWFSTELTTSSTTFYVIVTVQTVDMNTGQEAFTNQYGAVVEVAPDLKVETNSTYDGAAWPDGTNDATKGLGFYRGAWPAKLKTSKRGDAAPKADPKIYSLDAFPPEPTNTDADVFKKYRSESLTQGVQWAYTSSKTWADFRGTNADPSLAGQPCDPKVFYAAPQQARKQVRVRAVWSLNSGAY
ncbi:MAG TPA: hypothetical protein VEJ63_21995 [Planctomycetota bacterium]|nr:hypothetical protein [Planctomycetota bacterium]